MAWKWINEKYVYTSESDSTESELTLDDLAWVCWGCGMDLPEAKHPGVATWHDGTCDVCGKKTSVTEPRDFTTKHNPFPNALYEMLDKAVSGDDLAKEDPGKNDLLDSMERTFNSCMDIAAAKNHDYAADADPFRNFRECGRFGVSIDSGILVRMSDKWSRLCQLAAPGETAEVSDETLIDTLLDLINYAAILIAVYEDEA